MDRKSLNRSESEDNIQKAIESLKDKQFTSIRSAAIHFKIPKSTLINRITGRQSRSQSHKSFQKLSNAKEKTLVRWISQLTTTGYPATPGLLKEMAQEILNQYIDILNSKELILANWNLQGIKKPHLKQYQYSTLKSNWKVTVGKQEWITVLECVNTDGGSLLPIIIFKAQNTNTPLDIGVYGPMKRYHAQEVDRYSRAGIQRIQRSDWVQLFQKIREKGLIYQNIKSGWKEAGLNPFSPRQVLNNLPAPLLPLPSTPNTPSNPEDLDLSLLNSSPPNDIELRQANQIFNSALSANNLPTSPVQRYVKRITHQIESLNAENAILRKEIQEYEELLEI
ncbi:hypothetical protein SS1G_01174 [Sclerotinia sclerotiorum 1980 UF-70]|uniref:HTH CENPB-type domain-containing protein n=1 Tax=Sclerotinia sclerotiorum (strain ATCC 18683 / 1980 / Ss-1) TaxID=665079 RepID=A7E797_SCLS1|nr:hypothetical protein SS1G_01174 [Sclerotinia sclerotiorum 1980 UF-70]EDN96249.1 hypothetical protein SS1G_01174 [Sclerotinia sclerotiorum 1980 UF-70]